MNQPGGAQALAVLRKIWDAQGQSGADLAEESGNTKSCKTMRNIGFGGLADDPASAGAGEDAAPVGNDLRSAWRSKLTREGKLDPAAGTVHDLVFGRAEQER